MRITKVETFTVFAPGANPPFIWRDGLLGSPPDREVGVIRLRTDEGVDGVAIAPRRGAGPIVVDAFEHGVDCRSEAADLAAYIGALRK